MNILQILLQLLCRVDVHVLLVYKNQRIKHRASNILPYKTSSEIIKEAKESLTSTRSSIMNTRIVKTNRPFTPKTGQRILFEGKRSGRPTSSVSFQNFTYEETELTHYARLDNDDVGLQGGKVKLPSLVNYKSMTSLEKLPEEFSEIIHETREIYSSPALGTNPQSLIFNKNGSIWFPLVTNSVDERKLHNKYVRFTEAKPPSEKLQLSPNNTLDIEKTIQDNEINEARMAMKFETKDTIQNLIAAINKASIRTYKDEEMIDLLRRLYSCLEKDQRIQYNNDQHLAKNLILKTVFSLIHSANETLLLHVVQIILLLRVTESNLSTVCKLIFKISRSDRNDDLFLEKNIIGSFVNCLGLATPDDDSEALIYGYGALKFLMMNENILHYALDNGILQLMALHLKMINLAKTEGSNFPEQTSHVLFQLTGCLRNVANDESTHSKFVSSGTLSALCKTIKLFISDTDLVVNVARILSILSTNEECCELIADNENSLNTLLRICKRYPGREDIIVRIMYAIGNVLANCDRARFQLYSSSEGTLEIVLNLLQYYLEIDLKLSLENSFNKSHLLSVEDVFIKIVRVIANMCLDENVGTTLVSTIDSYEKIEEFLNCLLIILRRKTIHENEELIISTLSTLNNLSYYSHPDVKGPFTERCLDICEALSSFISIRNEDCVLEVARVYGNLSRLAVVRKYLLDTGNLNYILDWLDSPNKDLRLITTGVLINMMVEKEARQYLRFSKGIEKLIQNLRHSEEDWHLGNLVCQLLWNFSVDEDDLFVTLGYQQAQNLLYTLIDLLDEDRFFPDFTNQSSTLEYKLWEEFSFVATNILEKMETKNCME